jgi:hypothetical protein
MGYSLVCGSERFGVRAAAPDYTGSETRKLYTNLTTVKTSNPMYTLSDSRVN